MNPFLSFSSLTSNINQLKFKVRISLVFDLNTTMTTFTVTVFSNLKFVGRNDDSHLSCSQNIVKGRRIVITNYLFCFVQKIWSRIKKLERGFINGNSLFFKNAHFTWNSSLLLTVSCVTECFQTLKASSATCLVYSVLTLALQSGFISRDISLSLASLISLSPL